MNATKNHKLLAALLIGFLVAQTQNRVYASTLTQPLTLTSTYNSPLTVNGKPFGPSAHFKGHILFVSWDDTLALRFTPTAAVSGTLLSISSPGSVDLNLSKCDTSANIQFVPSGPGTISMNPSVTLGLNIALLWNGDGPSGTLNDPSSFSFPASSSFTCYGFTPATLSHTEYQTLYSEDVLQDVAAAFGIDIPDWLASVDLNVDADITVGQFVQSVGIFSSAGVDVYCEQPLSVVPSSCSYSLTGVEARWFDSVTISEGLSLSVSLSLLDGIITWSSGPLVSTGTLLAQTETIYPSSDPVGSVNFTFPDYTVTVVQAPNGTISPASPGPVCEGQCLTFTATPASGYYVCGWYVDGVLQHVGVYSQFFGGGTFRLSDIQATHTVTAAFCPWFAPCCIPTICCLTASNLTSSGAGVSGTFNPNGYAGAAWFQIGETAAYDNTTDPFAFGPGTTNINTSNVVTGLLPNTTYHFMLVLTNDNGNADSGDQTFTTAAIGPTVSTGAVTIVDGTTVLLNGSVNPNGSPATAWFNWGTDTNYGNATPIFDFLGDTAPDSVIALLTNLLSDTTYHYQLVATNGVGVAFTPDQVFTTAGLVPIITNVLVSSMTATTATLSASVNPNGLDTVVYMNWGTTTNYGTITPGTAIGNGTTDIVVSVTLGPLCSNCTYYAEVVATNAAGMAVSPNVVFGEVSQFVAFQITSILRQSNNVLITWTVFGGTTNVVQVSPGGVGGSYSTNNFVNLSPMIFVPGTGLNLTNYLDIGGATNKPARYYRVRLVP